MEVSTVKDDQIVTTHIDPDAKKAIDSALTVKDKLLVVLQMWATQRGTREIYQTIADVADAAGVHRPTAQVTFSTMVRKNEIEYIKEMDTKIGKNRIVGFKLNKVSDPKQIIAKGAEKAKTSPKVVKKMEPKSMQRIVHLREYMDKKDAVEQAKALLFEKGVEATINFEENPLAEEALGILGELIETTHLLGECQIEREAARRTEPFVQDEKIVVKS